MNQSTQLQDIPKDAMTNPDETRALQDLIDQNVDEMGGYGEQDFGVDQAYAQQQHHQQQQQHQFEQQQAAAAAYHQQAPHPNESPVQLQNQMGIGLQQPMPPLQPGMRPEQCAPNNMQFPSSQFQPRGMMPFPPPPGVTEEDWSEFLLRESKDSIVVIILFVLLNLSFVEGLLLQYVPYMDNNYLTLVAKAVVAGALFYGVKKLWR